MGDTRSDYNNLNEMGDTRAGLRFYLIVLAVVILSPVISSKDKPARLIIRSLFGFAPEFQTEPLDPL